jgi:hypothetical protein
MWSKTNTFTSIQIEIRHQNFRIYLKSLSIIEVFAHFCCVTKADSSYEDINSSYTSICVKCARPQFSMRSLRLREMNGRSKAQINKLINVSLVFHSSPKANESLATKTQSQRREWQRSITFCHNESYSGDYIVRWLSSRLQNRKPSAVII